MPHIELLFKRACVQCPSNSPPCKECPSGQVCNLSVQTCQKCPEAQCVPADSGSKSNAGAIAGGVVGGLVGLGFIIGILLWYKFRYRRSRRLQEQKERELANQSPPQSPMLEETSYSSRDAHYRAPSITTTQGGASGNIIPIVFPFQRRGDAYDPASPFASHDDLVAPRATLLGGDGAQTVIRDSIRDSEYSVHSEYLPGANNQGLRTYDVAVQGLPSLVELSQERKRSVRLDSTSRLAGGKLYDIGELQEGMLQRGSSLRHGANAAESSQQPPSTRSVESRSRLSSAAKIGGSRRSMTDASSHLNDRPGSNHQQLATAADNNRASRASSREYIAELPDEARLYMNDDLFEEE